MDPAPAKLPTSTSRLIAMAISLVGETAPVVAVLKCSPEDFRGYCAGSKEPPLPEYDRLIDLIIREQGKIISKNRILMAELAAKRAASQKR